MTETLWLQESFDYEQTLSNAEPALQDRLRNGNPFFRQENVRCFVCTQPFLGYATAAITRCPACAKRDGPLCSNRLDRNLVWQEIIEANDQLKVYQAKVQAYRNRLKP